MLVRTSTFTLKFANESKREMYWRIIRDCQELTQMYIDMIHGGQLPLKTNLSTKLLPILNDVENSNWRAMCYREASQIYRSAKAHAHGKTPKKPTLEHFSCILNYHLWNIEFDKTKEFDAYIKIYSPYKKSVHKALTFNIPIKFHRVYNNLIDKGWQLNNQSMILRDNFSLCLYLEHEEIEKKDTDKAIGLDCGYKKLIASSDGNLYGKNLENIYNKISRKKQGSKAFKRALKERDCAINKTVKDFYNEHNDCGVFVCENLKNVKKGKKFSKKFNNKLQRWSYTKTLNKLESLSETEGFRLVKVNPAYTSQRCHHCKSVIKTNRNGEHYHCSVCGESIDADINAAINILQLGVYSPQFYST